MKIKSKVWSNAFFIVPLVLTFWYSLYLHSIIISLVIVSSTIYHLSNEQKFKLTDKILAHILIAYNLYLCYLSEFKQPYFLLALVFVFLALYILYKKEKDDWEWHASSAMITLLCILAYVS
jgi:hypothetical protein